MKYEDMKNTLKNGLQSVKMFTHISSLAVFSEDDTFRKTSSRERKTKHNRFFKFIVFNLQTKIIKPLKYELLFPENQSENTYIS